MKNINWKPKNDLDKAGLKIVQLLNKAKFQAFFVGGAVRDYLLKKQSTNIDIATDALPDQIEEVLTKAKINFKQVGKKFGTILAIVNKYPIEITTFRKEGRYSDQRHPDQVEFIHDYLEDARRRDLTINALYLNPVTGELFDPVNGIKDLERKLIRFVGDPKKRIDEDSLRVIRAVRLATTLGFKVEKNSFAAIKTRAKYIQDVSRERVKLELDKVLSAKNRGEGIRLLDSSGLLKFILPELIEAKKIYHNSKKYHLEGSIFDHTIRAMDFAGNNLDIVYATLFHDLGKIKTGQVEYHNGEWVSRFKGHQQVSQKIFREFAREYKFSKRSSDLIDWLINHHDDRLDFRSAKESTQIKYALHEDFPLLLEVWNADSCGNLRLIDGKLKHKVSQSYLLGKKLLANIEKKRSLMDRVSSGKFIMKETKIAPGIRIGQIAEKIKIAVMDGSIKNENDAKECLKKYKK